MQDFEQGGVIYRDLGNGEVEVVGYSDQPPVDPGYQKDVSVLPYAAPKAKADLQRAQNQASASQYDPALAAAQLQAAQLAAENQRLKIETERENLTTPEDLQRADQARTDKVKNILSIVKESRTLANKGRATDLGSLLSTIPGTDARDLQGLVATLQGNLSFDRLQEMRTDPANKTGGALGAVSERELALLGSTVASLDAGQSTEQFLANLDRIENHYARAQAAFRGVDPDSQQGRDYVRQTFGVGNAPKGPSQTDKTQSFTDPRQFDEQYQVGIDERFATDNDKKFATLAQAKFDQGASFGELDSLAKQYGYQGFPGDLNDAIAYRDGTGRYQNQGPQKGARIAAPESGYNDPGIAERAYQGVASSPVGAYFGQAANALTLGGLDEIQGVAKGDTLGEAFGGTGVNTAEANLRKGLQAGANPISSILGNVAGGALGVMATGGATGAARATSALAPRALAGDATFGALYGAGESNQDRVAGAGMGLLAAAGGGALGRNVAPKLGQLATGVQDPAKRLLNERGVRLMPGQIFNRTAKEDRLAGLPGSDVPINAARGRQFEQFNRAAFDEGMAPIGATVPNIAERGVEGAKAAVSRSYDDTLDGVIMTPDKQLEDALAQRIASAQQIPNLGDQAVFGLQKSIEEFVPADTITGKNFQNIQQNLTRRAGKFDRSGEAVGPDAAQILRQTSGDFNDLAARQAPEIVPQLQASNQAYGSYKTLQNAVSRGSNTGGVFSPAQLGMAAKANAKKFGQKQGTTGQQFFELQRAGQDVLPQKIPDSGTAGRAAEGGIIDNVKSGVRGATNRALYAPQTIDLLNKLAFERPDMLIKAGQAIQKRSRLGGIFGAPALLPTID